MRRRTVLATLSAAICGCGTTEPRRTVDIGLFVTQSAIDAYGSRTANELAHVIDDTFTRLFPTLDQTIGIEGIVEVPTSVRRGSPITAIKWWQTVDVDNEDANLLLFAYDNADWRTHHGYAVIGGRHAVMTAYEYAGMRTMENLALHEIGHCLGARHEDGAVRDDTMTVMADSDRRRTREFTDRTKRTFRANL